jgi:hypothetical protein
LPLFDLFTSATQVEVSKALLEAFAKNKSVTSDPLLINTVFTAAKVHSPSRSHSTHACAHRAHCTLGVVFQALHDSVNALSFSDEVRQITSLISTFISKVSNTPLS